MVVVLEPEAAKRKYFCPSYLAMPEPRNISPDCVVLGLETSCDETAAAVVTGKREVLDNVVLSQLDDHRPYGGVVPEIAARAHVEQLDGIIARAMNEAGLGFADLDAIAATAGPGLVGGVMVGLVTAKAIAAAARRPLIAVNHLEGHALSARLVAEVEFPFLCLLVSGGHCQLLVAEGVGRYRRLGSTIDDAVGEAFDKTAKLLGLGYPGGPALERAAAGGQACYDLPRPMLGRENCDFSFSGLKTAVRHLVEGLGPGAPSTRQVADVAASFQAAVGDVLADRCARAIAILQQEHGGGSLVVAGGVAANATVRSRLEELATAHGIAMVAPPPALCTDNGAMIAWAGVERLALGFSDPLDVAARARWPLDATEAGLLASPRRGRSS